MGRFTRRQGLGALAAWGGGWCWPAVAAPFIGDAPVRSGLSGWVEAFVARHRIAGAVVQVSGPEGEASAWAGLSDLSRRQPMSAATRFYIASCGKLATTAAVVQAQLQGRFALGDAVAPLLAPLPGVNWRQWAPLRGVTVEHLLRHRSGLPEYYDEAFEALTLDPAQPVPTVASIVAGLKEASAEFPPGRQHSYCNTNFVLLGHLLASVDGRPFPEVLRQRLWTPLGLKHTTVGAQAGPQVARAYAAGAGRRAAAQDVSRAGWTAHTGDGAVVTTAAEQARFMQALFVEEKLLPYGTASRWCDGLREAEGYGLGCMQVRTRRHGVAWGHNGAVTGISAESWWVPKFRRSVVLLCNGDVEADSADLLNDILAAVA